MAGRTIETTGFPGGDPPVPNRAPTSSEIPPFKEVYREYFDFVWSSARRLGIQPSGMDDLIQAAQERRLSQLMRLAPVRAAIDERLNRLRSDLATRAIGRRLAELRGSFEQIAAEEA